MRVGFGYDSHCFSDEPSSETGALQKLGGVPIPDCPRLVGHSDADVLIHAIIDALLGAAALGDIGSHFPDDDPLRAPVVNWRSTGQLLYTNWLNYYVYQSVPYDIESIGSDEER